MEEPLQKRTSKTNSVLHSSLKMQSKTVRFSRLGLCGFPPGRPDVPTNKNKPVREYTIVFPCKKMGSKSAKATCYELNSRSILRFNAEHRTRQQPLLQRILKQHKTSLHNKVAKSIPIAVTTRIKESFTVAQTNGKQAIREDAPPERHIASIKEIDCTSQDCFHKRDSGLQHQEV